MPAPYPPDPHLLRDLRIEVEDPNGAPQLSAPLPSALLSRAGAPRVGVLAVLLDVVGGQLSIAAAGGDWVATSDLTLSLLRAAKGDALWATGSVLRAGRTAVVAEVSIGVDSDADDPLALGTTTFTRLPRREGNPTIAAGERRTEFARDGSGFRAPFPEQLGMRVRDPRLGDVEIDLCDYVVNSVGALQGGAVASLADLACEVAAGERLGAPAVTTDLAIQYLSFGRVGPMRTRAEPLRVDAAHALFRIEVRDTGQDDRVVSVATATGRVL